MQRKQKGFTLFEWLLASTLSLGSFLCLFQLYSSLHQLFLYTAATFEINENADTALAGLTNDIRMAGFMGCVPLGAVDTYSNGELLNTPLRGYTSTDLHPCWHHLPKNFCHGDVLCIQYADPDGFQVHHAQGHHIICEQALPLNKHTYWIIEDCKHRELVTSKNFELQHTYEKGAYVRPIHQIIYYVAPTKRFTHSKESVDALYRLELPHAHQPREYVENLEELEILYGVFEKGVLREIKAAAVTDWSSVRHVTIRLYARSSLHVLHKRGHTQHRPLRKTLQQTAAIRAFQPR